MVDKSGATPEPRPTPNSERSHDIPETTPPADESIILEPTAAELDEWAERERQRREAWLRGPTTEERAAYARRERQRRLVELEGEDAFWAQRARLMRRYPREAQLAAEGAMSLLVRWSRRTMADLVRAGREWEDEFAQPTRRRRIRLDDDDAT